MKRLLYLIAVSLFLHVNLQSQSINGFSYKSIPNQYLSKIGQRSVSIPTNAIDLTKLLPKGFKKDGSVDYTDYLQNGIDQYDVILMPNFPILINDKGLKLRSNTSIYFNSGSKLIMKASNKGTDSNTDVYQMLLLDKVNNVNIYNATLVGDRRGHIGTKGEWGHGINIQSSKNIKVSNANISNCWGDGLYIGRNKRAKYSNGDYIPSANVLVENSIIDNNRRNGISLTCGIDITIKNSLLSNQNGTLPMSGLDIEPNVPSDAINNINLDNVTTFHNAQDGLLLVLTKLSSRMKINNCNITISNHIDDSSYAAMRIGSGFPRGNKALSGSINVSNSTWINSYGLRFRQGYEQLPNTKFNNIKLISPLVLGRSEKYRASGNSKTFNSLIATEKNIQVQDVSL